MKNKYLFMLFFATLLTACHVHTDEEHLFPLTPLPKYDSFEFDNRSNHIVRITDDLVSWELLPNQTQCKRVNCLSGGTFYFNYMEGMTFDADDEFLFKGAIRVLFDNKYEITHTEAIPHSLASESSYDTHQTTSGYYTFTDEDYDYAVEHGVKLDEPIE